MHARMPQVYNPVQLELPSAPPLPEEYMGAENQFWNADAGVKPAQAPSAPVPMI